MRRADLSEAIDDIRRMLLIALSTRRVERWEVPYRHTAGETRRRKHRRIQSLIAALRLLRAEQRRSDLCELEPGHAGQCEARRK